MVEAYIGRIVAGVVTPLLLPLAGAFAIWVNKATGLDLDGAELTAYVGTVVTGVAAVGYKWLSNRGEYEKLKLELEKLYEAGRHIQDDPVQ